MAELYTGLSEEVFPRASRPGIWNADEPARESSQSRTGRPGIAGTYANGGRGIVLAPGLIGTLLIGATVWIGNGFRGIGFIGFSMMSGGGGGAFLIAFLLLFEYAVPHDVWAARFWRDTPYCAGDNQLHHALLWRRRFPQRRLCPGFGSIERRTWVRWRLSSFPGL